MKKNFYYLALAAIVAMGMTACGSDDDDVVEPDPVNLPKPTYADKAVEYNLQTALNAKSSTGVIEQAPALSSINFCEDGKVLLELIYLDRRQYVMEEATYNNGVYDMNGKTVRGTIKVANAAARTRGGAEIIVDITVTVTITETFTYTSNGETITVTETRPATGDEVMTNLARTWNVTGAILDLRSRSKDIKAYEEFDSNSQGYFDMRQIRKEALDQGMSLTIDEQQELERMVKNVTITNTNKFIVEYTDHEADVAEWEWNNPEKTSIRIKLKDGHMGNKFISDDTRIDIAFNGNRCNMKMETKTDDAQHNDWEIMLTMKLKY